MKRCSPESETRARKRFVRRGPYCAEVTAEGNLYRFVIRDENRVAPTIHGSKKSLRETESELQAVLDRLCPEQQAA